MKPIQMLESEYFGDDNAAVKIPVRNTSDMTSWYGNSYFAVEPQFTFRGKGKKKKAWITELLIRIPHLINPGYQYWRKIKCRTPRLLVDGHLRSLMISGCLDHNKPVIEFYPPRSARLLIIDDLFSGVCMDIKWEGEDGKSLNLIAEDFRSELTNSRRSS